MNASFSASFLLIVTLITLSPYSPASASVNPRGCRPELCAVQISVSKSSQTLTLKVGSTVETMPVSTGRAGTPTPSFDVHPDGRMYTDYMMSTPYSRAKYVVFLRGGFSIFGTPYRRNQALLGHAVSHGGILLSVEDAQFVHGVVSEYGVENVFVRVH